MFFHLHKHHRRHGRHAARAAMAEAMNCGPQFATGFGRGPDFGDDFPFGSSGPGGSNGFGRGRRGGGRRGRMYDGNELKLLLLHLISTQPRHGYDLIREIEERSGGQYAPSPGVVYPTLTMLDDMGLIELTDSEGAKKRYAITESGTAELAEKVDEVARLLKRLEKLGEEQNHAGHAPVRRAMGNLATAVMHRVRAGDLDADALHKIAAILDEAAQKVERS